MRLKSFYARTMTEAMQMIRESLGEDAIIVATREEQGGKAVRVTAAIDNDDYASAAPTTRQAPRTVQKPQAAQKKSPAFEIDTVNTVATGDDWLQYDDEDGEDGGITEQLTDALLRHGVPEEVTDPVLSACMVMGIDNPEQSLATAFENLYSFAPLMPEKQAPRGRIFMFVGPPGSGKTLTTAKFAARAVLQDSKALVLTADTVRAGSVEQLEAFTKLLDVPLHKVKSFSEIKEHLANISDDTYVFIDTPGLSPYSPENMKTLNKLVAAGNIEPVFVLPAGLDAAECADMARIYSSIGVKRLLPSRLDISRRYGGILAAAHAGHFAFAEAGHNAHVAEGLQTLSARKLAQYLLPASLHSSASPQGGSSSFTKTQAK